MGGVIYRSTRTTMQAPSQVPVRDRGLCRHMAFQLSALQKDTYATSKHWGRGRAREWDASSFGRFGLGWRAPLGNSQGQGGEGRMGWDGMGWGANRGVESARTVVCAFWYVCVCGRSGAGGGTLALRFAFAVNEGPHTTTD